MMRFALLTTFLMIQTSILRADDESFEERVKRVTAAQQRLAAEVLHQERANQSLISTIRPWYLNPDSRRLPKVIGLWGPTGTGKNSSIDIIIDELGLRPSTVKLDMQAFADANDTGALDHLVSEGPPVRSIPERIIRNFLTYAPYEFEFEDPDIAVDFDSSYIQGIPTVEIPRDLTVVLDEFQYARTLDKDGDPISNSKFQPIWEILGNQGKISIPNPRARFFAGLLEDFDQIFYIRPKEEESKRNGSDGAKAKEDRRKERRKQEVIKEIKAKLKKLKDAEPNEIVVDLSSALFFVSGNLDRLFEGSTVYDPELADADEIHAAASRITSDDLRRHLGRIFTAKDLSRLGSPNQHILFLPFSKSAFQNLVNGLVQIEVQAARKLGIQVEVDPSLFGRIYDEVVVPSQGVRPLQGSIPNFFGDAAAAIRAQLTERGIKPSQTLKVRVKISETDPQLTEWEIHSGLPKPETFKFFIPSESIREQTPYAGPLGTLSAFYYASQTAVFIATRNELPRSVHSRSRSARAGFLNVRRISDEEEAALNPNQILEELAWKLGGLAAEEILYGKPTAIVTADLADATNLAASVAGGQGVVEWLVSTDVLKRDLNDPTQELLEMAKKKAAEIISKEQKFIIALTEILIQKTRVESGEILALLRKHWSSKENIPTLSNESKPTNPCTEKVKDFLRGKIPLANLNSGKIGFKPPATE